MRKQYWIILLAMCLFLPACKKKQPYRIPQYYDSSYAYSNTQGQVIKYEESGQRERVITVEEDGDSFQVHAVEGQLVVIFAENISYQDALGALKSKGSKVLAQFPNAQYYMIEVPAGEEYKYLSSLRECSEIDYVFPNLYEKYLSVTSHVIDGFNVNKEGYVHGNQVAFLMAAGDYPIMETIKTHDISIPNSDKKVDSNKKNEEICDILEDLRDGESAVINLSIGQPLYNKNGDCDKVLWNDSDVQNNNRKDYINTYKYDLKSLIKLVRAYDDKDFVITKAAGNEGMKELETIINKLEKSLSSRDLAIFRRHFIIVSAQDDNKEGDYPNEVTNYHPMVTKVDISYMTAQDLHWQGTSFSAPRAASYIIEAANEYNIKVVDALNHVRRVTKNSTNHLLTYEQLVESIRNENIVTPTKTEPNPTNGAHTYYVKLNEDLPFTLEDGSHGTLRLYTFGLGDLTFKIYWSGNNPIDVDWRLDGYGLAPMSGHLSSTYKYRYEISHTEFFRWTDSDADVRGVKIYVTPK